MASFSRSKTFHHLPVLSTSDEIYQSYLNKRSDSAGELKYYWSSCGVQFCPGCDAHTCATNIPRLLPKTDAEDEKYDTGAENGGVKSKRAEPTEEEIAEWHANCPMPDCKYRKIKGEGLEGESDDWNRGEVKEDAENAHMRCPLVGCKYREKMTVVGDADEGDEEGGKETGRNEDVDSAHRSCPLEGCRYRREYERKIAVTG
jgi:hypothetical protein